MIFNYFGHFHPLVVHLPIGVLLVAFVLEYVNINKKSSNSNAVEITLLIGAASSLLSALLGWFLSFSGEYDNALLTIHKWFGVSLCITSSTLWAVKKYARRYIFFKKLYNPLFFSTILLLITTGHFGGSLTHGEEYLSYQSLVNSERQQPELRLKGPLQLSDITADLTVYDNLINPILSEKCLQCHNEKKKKGDFQMNNYAYLMAGGKTSKKSKINNAQNSEVIKRILMDKEEDKHMPPVGKRPLTKAEIDIICWWFKMGASADTKILEVKNNDTVKAFFSIQGSLKVPALSIKEVPAADPADVSKLEAMHWFIKPIYKGSPLLEVNAVNITAIDDANLVMLDKISSQVVWLMLGNTGITDAGMVVISKMKNVIKLNLQKTSITDASVSYFNQLKALEYLNVSGTAISDIGLRQIKVSKSLKKIFCWNTHITPNGIEAFKKINPSVQIEYFK